MKKEQNALARMTTYEAKERLSQTELVVIPIGSTEQHGENMTMDTDIVLATEVAGRLAERLFPQILIAPPIPVGISYHHMDFPGSLTLHPNTLQHILTDYIKSFKRHGIHRFLLLNGHGGNQQTLSVFATVARHELGVEIANLFYWNLATNEIKEQAVSERFGHACEIEASFGLYLAPEIVCDSSLRQSDMLENPYRHSGYGNGLRVDVPYTFAELTRDGSFGDARAASKEKGERLIELILNRLVEFSQDFIQKGRGNEDEKE
jgi:creatinine amidohydrolase